MSFRDFNTPAVDDNVSPASVINPNARPSYMDNGNPTSAYDFDFDSRVRKRLSDAFDDTINERPDTIKMYLRVRPTGRWNRQNQDAGKLNSGGEVFFVQDNKTLLVRPPVKYAVTDASETTYTYSRVFDQDTSQAEIYEECARKVVNGFLQNGDGLIFSYGATNSGKTYTMQGYGKEFGIIPRTLDQLFGRIEDCLYRKADIKPHQFNSYVILDRNTQKLNVETRTRVLKEAKIKPSELTSFIDSILRGSSTLCSSLGQLSGSGPSSVDDGSSLGSLPDKTILYSIWVSFSEIYNERVYDLFDPILKGKKRRELKILQDKQNHVYIKDLTECHVNSPEEAYKFFLAGKQNLQFASTNVNANSSRSHSFFNIRMVVIGKVGTNIYPKEVRRFSFCDLAGLERSSQTGNVGSRLKESGTINQSLLVLLRCIRALRDKQNGLNSGDVIPYRDSKLTRLFQSYLTSETQISMIVNINPDPEMIDSSIQVIHNSAIASTIHTFKRIEPPANESHFYRKVRLSIRVQGANYDDESDDDTPVVSTIKKRNILPSEPNRTEKQIERRIKAAEDEVRRKMQEDYDRILTGQRDNYERLMKLERDHAAISTKQQVNLAVAAVTDDFYRDDTDSDPSASEDAWGEESPNNFQNGDGYVNAGRRHTVAATPSRGRSEVEVSIVSPTPSNEYNSKSQVAVLLSENKKLKAEMEDLVATLHGLTDANADKGKKLKSVVAENQELATRLDSAELESRTFKEMLSAKDREIRSLKQDHSREPKLKHISELTEQLARANAQNASLSKDVEDAAIVCVEYDGKLVRANQTIQELTSEVNDLNHQLMNKKQDEEVLHLMIDNLQQQVDNAESKRATKSPVFLKPQAVYGSILHSSKTSPSSAQRSERPRRVTAKYGMNGPPSASSTAKSSAKRSQYRPPRDLDSESD